MLSSGEVQRILAKTGEKITQQELLEMVNQADGCLDYKEFCSGLLHDLNNQQRIEEQGNFIVKNFSQSSLF